MPVLTNGDSRIRRLNRRLPSRPEVPFKAPSVKDSWRDEDGDDGTRPVFQRYSVAFGIVAVVLIAAGFGIRTVVNSQTASKPPPLVIVSLPPPLPPPPVQTVPPETVRDQQTFEPEEKPTEELPKPPDEPPIGTNIKGDGGSNAFSLGNSAGNGLGNRGSNASRFGWYAGQVESTVSDALRKNSKTSKAELSVKVRIWADESGRIGRAQLSGSTGDAGIDRAIEDEVLTGLQLREAPPAGMPMPIVMRLSAKRPR